MGGAIAGVVIAAVAAIGLVVYARRRSRLAKQGALNDGGFTPSPADAEGFDAAAAVGEVGHDGDMGVSAVPAAAAAARSGGRIQSLRMATGERRRSDAPPAPAAARPAKKSKGKGSKRYLAVSRSISARVGVFPVPEYASTHNHADSGSDAENERGGYGDAAFVQPLPLDENAHVSAPSAPSQEAWPAEEVGGDEAFGAHGAHGATPAAASDEDCVGDGLSGGVNPLARLPSLPAGGWCVEQRAEAPVQHTGGAPNPGAADGVKRVDGGACGAADMPAAATPMTATDPQPQPSSRTFAPPANAQADLRGRIARGPPLLAVFEPTADSGVPGVVLAEDGRAHEVLAPGIHRTSTAISTATSTAAAAAAAGSSAGTAAAPVRTPPLPRSWGAVEAPSAPCAPPAAAAHGSGASTAAACAPAQPVQAADAIDALTADGPPAGASKPRAPVARAVSHAALLAPRSRVQLLASATPVAAAGSSRALLTLASPRSPDGSPPGFAPPRAALSAAGAAVLSPGRLHGGVGSPMLGSPGTASPASLAQRTPSLAASSPGEAGGLLLARQRSTMRLLTERLPDDRPRGPGGARAPVSAGVAGIGATSAW